MSSSHLLIRLLSSIYMALIGIKIRLESEEPNEIFTSVGTKGSDSEYSFSKCLVKLRV
jgi:hypothetical protein